MWQSSWQCFLVAWLFVRIRSQHFEQNLVILSLFFSQTGAAWYRYREPVPIFSIYLRKFVNFTLYITDPAGRGGAGEAAREWSHLPGIIDAAIIYFQITWLRGIICGCLEINHLDSRSRFGMRIWIKWCSKNKRKFVVNSVKLKPTYLTFIHSLLISRYFWRILTLSPKHVGKFPVYNKL